MSRPQQPQLTAPRRSRPLVVGILLVGLLLGLCAAMVLGRISSARRGPTYETTARVRLSLNMANAHTAQPHPTITDQDAQTHALMFKSTRLLHRSVETFRLQELPTFEHMQPQEIALRIADDLTTYVVPGPRPAETAEVEITCRSPSAVGAMTIVKAVIRTYDETLRETSLSAAADALQQVAKARDELEIELKQQRQAMKALLREAPSSSILTNEDGPNHPEQSRRRVLQERDTLDLRRAALQALLKTADDAKQSGTSPAVIGQMLRRDPLFRPLDPEPGQVGPTAPATPKITIDNEASLSQLFERINVELMRLATERKDLDEQIQRVEHELAYVRDFTTRRRLMETEVQEKESLQQALSTRQQELERTVAAQTPTLEIVQPPDSAREVPPTWPPFFSAEVGVGAVLGFLLGVIGLTFYFAFRPVHE